MPRPLTIEDTFEYHAKRILREVMTGAELKGWTKQQKSDWLWENSKAVGEAFINDLDSWSGVAEMLSEMEG